MFFPEYCRWRSISVVKTNRGFIAINDEPKFDRITGKLAYEHTDKFYIPVFSHHPSLAGHHVIVDWQSAQDYPGYNTWDLGFVLRALATQGYLITKGTNRDEFYDEDRLVNITHRTSLDDIKEYFAAYAYPWTGRTIKVKPSLDDAHNLIVRDPILLGGNITLEFDDAVRINIKKALSDEIKTVFQIADRPGIITSFVHIKGGQFVIPSGGDPKVNLFELYSKSSNLQPPLVDGAARIRRNPSGNKFCGITKCRIKDLVIKGVHTSVKLTLDNNDGNNNAWINANTISGIHGDVLNCAVEFNFDERATQPNVKFNNNHFSDFALDPTIKLTDSSGQTMEVIKNVAGRGNQFINIRIWDINNKSDTNRHKRVIVARQALNSLFVGGLLSQKNADDFVNNGKNTCVIGGIGGNTGGGISGDEPVVNYDGVTISRENDPSSDPFERITPTYPFPPSTFRP